MARTAQTYASQPLLAQDWPNESHNSQHDTQPYQQTITDHPVWSQSGEQEQGLQHCYGQIAAPRSVAASTLSSPAADAQTVVAAHYCAPVTTTFFVKDKLLSWSGSDANILDEHGNIAFVVDSKTLSLRGSRVLKDATGNSVCALQAKVDLETS